MPKPDHILKEIKSLFHPAVKRWFTKAFDHPTEIQRKGLGQR